MAQVEEFEHIQNGASQYIPIQAGSIKKGGFCMLRDFPCKVIEYSTAKTGKHGSAKATIVGIDIFTNKKYEDGWPTSHTVKVPVIKKMELKVVDVDEDGFVSFQMEDGNLKQDLKLPQDQQLRQQLLQLWNESDQGQKTLYYTIISACGRDKIISGRLHK